jgi:mevalonate kinase
LIFDKNKIPCSVEIPAIETQNPVSIFLIDTDIQGKTNIMVSNFLEKFAPEGKIIAKANEFVKLTDLCIDFYIKGNSSQFIQTLKSLSEFQFENMEQLIPENIKEIWQQGLDNNKLIMKICGSGGGGYLLGFANNKNQAIEFLKNMHTGFIEVRFAKTNNAKKQDITS